MPLSESRVVAAKFTEEFRLIRVRKDGTVSIIGHSSSKELTVEILEDAKTRGIQKLLIQRRLVTNWELYNA